MSRLELLHLEHSPIADAGLIQLGRIGTLRWLDRGDSRISNRGLAHLLKLAKLEHLSLCGTGRSDEGIETLNRLPNLQFLNMCGSHVTKVWEVVGNYECVDSASVPDDTNYQNQRLARLTGQDTDELWFQAGSGLASRINYRTLDRCANEVE